MLKSLTTDLAKELVKPLVFFDSEEEVNRSFVLTGLAADFNALTNAVSTDNIADYLMGTNAMLLEGDGLGGNEAVNAISPNTIVYAPVSMVRVKIKDIAKTAAKRWIRLSTGNIDDAGNISFNITDIAVGNTGSAFSEATIVSITNGWTQIEFKCTLGGPDFTGNFKIIMSDADNDGTIANGTSGNELGIHELIISSVT